MGSGPVSAGPGFSSRRPPGLTNLGARQLLRDIDCRPWIWPPGSIPTEPISPSSSRSSWSDLALSVPCTGVTAAPIRRLPRRSTIWPIARTDPRSSAAGRAAPPTNDWKLPRHWRGITLAIRAARPSGSKGSTEISASMLPPGFREPGFRNPGFRESGAGPAAGSGRARGDGRGTWLPPENAPAGALKGAVNALGGAVKGRAGTATGVAATKKGNSRGMGAATKAAIAGPERRLRRNDRLLGL